MSSLFGKILDTRPKPNEAVGHIELLDTTLRDGEQTSGVSFSTAEKLSISRMLLTNLRVPRIEIGSCHVSIGEFESAKAICQWAADNGQLSRIEILGFIDGGKSQNIDTRELAIDGSRIHGTDLFSVLGHEIFSAGIPELQHCHYGARIRHSRIHQLP